MVVGVIVWGLGMAAQESIVKAAITGMVDPRRRAWAYGVFDTGFGICWFAGSIALGALYDRSVIELAIFSAAVQLAALPFLAVAARTMRGQPEQSSGRVARERG